MGVDVVKIVAILLKIVYLRNVKALLQSFCLVIKFYVELCSMCLCGGLETFTVLII